MATPDQIVFTSLREQESKVQAVLAHVVEVHNRAKRLFILAEDLDGAGFSDFLQPVLELRHALEHLVRGFDHQMDKGMQQDGDFDYMRGCFEKALGHEYRCFFDSADWISVRYREKVIDLLKPFSVEQISRAIPDWYSSLNPRMEKINREIATIRGRKDISKKNEVVKEAIDYESLINELQQTYDIILYAVPSLLEIKNCTKRSMFWKWAGIVLTALITGVVGLITGYLLKP